MASTVAASTLAYKAFDVLKGGSKDRWKDTANRLQDEKDALEAKASEADTTKEDLSAQLEVEKATLSPEEQMAAGAPRRTKPVVRASLLSQDAERRKRSLLAQ